MNNQTALVDIASPALILPGILLLIIAFALAIAKLDQSRDKTKRALALLIILLSAFAILREMLPLPLSSGLSLAIFLSLFGVFYLLGKFESGK